MLSGKIGPDLKCIGNSVVLFGGQDSWLSANTNASDCTFEIEESRIWKLDKRTLNSKWKNPRKCGCYTALRTLVTQALNSVPSSPAIHSHPGRNDGLKRPW